MGAAGVAAKPVQASPQPLLVKVDPGLPPGVGVAVGAAPDVRLAMTGNADIHLVPRDGKLMFATTGGDFIAEAEQRPLCGCDDKGRIRLAKYACLRF